MIKFCNGRMVSSISIALKNTWFLSIKTCGRKFRNHTGKDHILPQDPRACACSLQPRRILLWTQQIIFYYLSLWHLNLVPSQMIWRICILMPFRWNLLWLILSWDLQNVSIVIVLVRNLFPWSVLFSLVIHQLTTVVVSHLLDVGIK